MRLYPESVIKDAVKRAKHTCPMITNDRDMYHYCLGIDTMYLEIEKHENAIKQVEEEPASWELRYIQVNSEKQGYYRRRTLRCGKCGYNAGHATKYCPDCGKKMLRTKEMEELYGE